MDGKDSIQSPLGSKEAIENKLEQILADVINNVVETDETISDVGKIQSALELTKQTEKNEDQMSEDNINQVVGTNETIPDQTKGEGRHQLLQRMLLCLGPLKFFSKVLLQRVQRSLIF